MMDISTWVECNQPMQILVVDDDEAMLTLLTATIQKQYGASASVRTVNDPRAACEILEANLIDVLVTDLEMPGVDGLQLLRSAKRRNAWTQVILITGRGFAETLMEAMDLGASDYLVKPLELADLRQALSEASARLRRWRQSLARTLPFAAARRDREKA